MKKLGCSATLLDCLSDLTTEQALSVSQNVGHFPFGLFVDSELITDLNMEDLLDIDLMFGMNDGDTFQWTNAQYNRPGSLRPTKGLFQNF